MSTPSHDIDPLRWVAETLLEAEARKIDEELCGNVSPRRLDGEAALGAYIAAGGACEFVSEGRKLVVKARDAFHAEVDQRGRVAVFVHPNRR